MKHCTRAFWIFALTLAPLYASQGCSSSSHPVSEDRGRQLGETSDEAEKDDDEASGKRPAELELCDVCKDPAPAAPEKLCDDGSSEGFVCAKKDLGDCGWLYRACPDLASDAGTSGSSFCGGIAGIQCPKGEYCRFDAQCGAADQGGLCMTVPQACSDLYKPVCGCDGKTYGNDCEAASNAVSVANVGECTDPKQCDKCPGPAPLAPNYECSDGSIGGPICAFREKTQTCGWTIRACPVSRDPCQNFECKPGYHCTAPADAPSCVPDETSDCNDPTAKPPLGTCWRNGDCASGQTCVGASCCPVGAQCFAADRPGACQ